MEAVLLHYGADRVPTGRGWRAMRCPFHDDSHASASTNGEAFYCHACEVQGDSLAIIMLQESCSFRDALEIGQGMDTDFRPDEDTRPTLRSGRKAGTPPKTVKRWSPPGRRARR